MVFSACGGFGRETGMFLQKLAVKIADKYDFPLSVVSNHLRTNISFDLIGSQVMCLRKQKINYQLENVEVAESESNIRE